MTPLLADFLSTARREFGFLVSDFAFTEQADPGPYPNPFSVSYVSSTVRVTVDGISWGHAVQVMLHAISPPTRHSFCGSSVGIG
jgi:hypothetical protein